MDTFEYITALVAVVIGLAIADLATSLHRLLRIYVLGLVEVWPVEDWSQINTRSFMLGGNLTEDFMVQVRDEGACS